jgi:cytosine deaminase
MTIAPLALTNCLLPDGSTTTVRIADGLVVSHTSQPADGDQVVDAAGRLVLPAAAEAHAHLDKAFLAETVPNPTGDLMGAINALEASRHLINRAETEVRAERAARLIAANGATFIRTHADLTAGNGVESVEALIAVRERLRHMVTIEVVALCDFPFAGAAGANARALLRDAIDLGIDLVGGCPHLENDPYAATDAYISAAAAAGLPLDLHTDETLDATHHSLGYLAEQVLASGFEQRVTASHCVSLGLLPADEQRRISDLVAEAGISVVTLPSSNLFLQGRDHHQAQPRGLTAVKALRAAGANLAAGWDNLQDPFNPMGRGDCLETAALMVMAGHLLPEEALHTVTNATRRAAGLRDAGAEVGMVADLVLVRADTIREAIAVAPSDRIVIRAGELVDALS